MSTTTNSLTTEINRCNAQLDCILKETIGVTVKQYRIILALVRFLAVIVCGTAVVLSPESTELALLVLGAVVAGPDFIEAMIMNTDPGDASDDQ